MEKFKVIKIIFVSPFKLKTYEKAVTDWYDEYINEVFTKVNYEQLKTEIHDNDINVDLNFKPSKYLCNYAYHNALLRNKNSIFIHIPGISKITNTNRIASILKEVFNG